MNRQSERLVKHYAKVIDKLTREGRKGLLSDLEAIDWSDVTEGANQAVDAMMRHCGRYSRGNAAMAAAYYDRLRKNEVGKVLGAVAECDYDPDELEDDVRGMVEGIREGKPRETFESKCADRFEYEARNAAKDCVGKNVARDPLKPRYAVVPGGTCCTFCAMLASRGPVYHDASSCEGLHAHCGCAAVPTWERDREGNFRLDLKGYNPEYYYDRWKHPASYHNEGRQDRMYSRGDPSREYFGSAADTNQARLNEITRIYRENNVEIIVHSPESETIAYEPSVTAGLPGRIHRTEGMSLSAEEHEFSHFEHDRNLGYPGLGYYLQNQSVWDDMEREAYGIEMKMAAGAGHDILVERLERQMEEDFDRRRRPLDERR